MHLKKPVWRSFKILVFCLSITPFILLLMDAWQDRLGANPVETLHLTLGDWALRFLCLTLLLTPYKQLTGQKWPPRFRRMLGLFSFFYATLHLLIYIMLDLSFSWSFFEDDIRESPYILFGLITFLLLLPLALTSTRSMKKRLGTHWKKLHRLIYPAAVLAILHFFLLVKSDFQKPLFYSVIVFLLLSFRLIKSFSPARSNNHST